MADITGSANAPSLASFAASPRSGRDREMLAAQEAAEKRIKVVHIIDVLSLTGMEYGVIKLLNRLDRQRFDTAICCLRFRADESRAVLDARIPVFELRRREGRDLRMIVRLAALLRAEQADAVHSHNWQTLFYAVAAARLARVPVIIHGEHGREGAALPKRRTWISRSLAPWLDRVVTVSADLHEDLRIRWRLRPERLRFIANGVDLDLFGRANSSAALRRELHLAPDNRVLLSVGRLAPVKDHATLLRGFARVYRNFPQARLLVVGSDNGTGAGQRLQEHATALGVRDAVRFTGVRQDIAQLLALCDVYVNTSLYEAMSNTILEAMAARKPLVATRVGGNPALVRNGLTGYLIEPGNDKALGEKLERLLKDKTAAEEMGAAGRAEVERHHPIADMVRAYGELYEETVSRYRSRHGRPIKERAKGWAANSIRWSGLNRAKDRLTARQLSILTYHRVLPLSQALDYPFAAMAMPKDLFEAQMAHLARHYTVLPFPDAIRLLQCGHLPQRAVVVTFDDGYLDNYEHAWPILKKYGIPATFFVVTGAVDGSVHLWWEEVAEAIERLSNGRRGAALDVPDWLGLLLTRLRLGGDLRAISRAAVDTLNTLGPHARRHCVQLLCEMAHFGRDGRPNLMLGWEHVRELRSCGMTIGSHTVTHAALDVLPVDEARREIEGSVVRLQDELQEPVRLFAYPRGRGHHGLEPLLEQAGIEAAVTTDPGRNAVGTNLLQLRRFDAGYSRLHSGFHAGIFEAELHGWFTDLRSAAATHAPWLVS